MALWGFGAKCGTGLDWTGLDGWMDTPQTVTTTRAPAVLIIQNNFNWLNKIVQCYVVMLQNV